MKLIEITEQIRAPVDAVFDLFADFENLPHYDPEVVAVDIWPGPPVGLGTKIIETRKLKLPPLARGAMKNTHVSKWEIAELVRPRRMTLEAPFAGMTERSVYEFTAVEGGTRLTATVEALASGMLSWPKLLLAWLNAGEAREELLHRIECRQLAVENRQALERSPLDARHER